MFYNISFKKPNILLFATIPQNQHKIYPKQLHHTCIGGLELIITKPLVKIPRIHTKVHQSIQNHRNKKNSLFISYQLRFYPHEFNKSRVRVISQQNPRKKEELIPMENPRNQTKNPKYTCFQFKNPKIQTFLLFSFFFFFFFFFVLLFFLSSSPFM